MDLGEIVYTTFWLLIYLVILLIAVSIFLSWKRKQYIKSAQYNLTFMQIKMRPQNETEIDAAEHFFSGLMGVRRTFWQRLLKGQYLISFEIVSKIDGIGFYVVVPDELLTFVEKQINGAYADAEIDIIDPNEVWDRGAVTAVAEINMAGPPYYPLKTYKDMEKNDSLNLLTSAMSNLKADEVLALQYVVSPATEAWRGAARAFIGHVKNKAADPEKGRGVDTSIVEGVEKKAAKPGFDIAIRVIAIAGSKTIAESHITNVVGAFEQFTDVRYNKLKRRRLKRNRSLVDDFIYRKMVIHSLYIPIFNISIYRNTAILNIEELATVYHFPNKNIQTPNIIWLTARKSSAPSNTPESGLYLGKNVFRNVSKKIYMKPDDRARHNYIIGQTGTGKSVFMSSLAIQDIYAGHGVAYIDPHGSEIAKLLEQIPPEREDDVILFDVSDTDFPLGINILEAQTDEQRNMNINAFIALLYKLYDPNRQGIMGPQLERAIRNVMLTAMIDPESSLVDVLRMLIDEKYAKSYISRIQDPLVKKYWTDEVANTSQARKGETIGYFVSKFDRFVTEKFMRNIIGQPKSSFNFADIMANKQILLVDLSKGKIGEENSNFLGLILVPKILQAALARASLLGKVDFPHFYLYVDEFQNFATPDFATILSEARKYKLNLTVAHQFVAQLPDEIKDAVFGNVGTMEVFRVGTEDAEYLEPHFAPVFNQNDLMNNPVGNCYIRLLVDGHPSIPFSLNIEWDFVNSFPKSKETVERIRQKSRAKYGRPAGEIEEYINRRIGLYDPPPVPEPSPAGMAPNPKKLIPF